MKKQLAVLSLLSLFSFPAFAQPTPISTEYITEGGRGVLTIKKAEGHPDTFTLETLGANGHGCYLDGKINNGVSIMSEILGEKCTVKFKETSAGIAVISEGEDCHMMYCGMRASFSSEIVGEYVKVSANCTPGNINKTRQEALKLYKAKKYSESLAKLETVLNNCSKTLYWIDKAWIQNDLAVTYAKLHQNAKCGAVLADLKKEAESSEEEVKENLPPLEGELYWPVVKATKTNLRLCKIQ